MTTRRRFLTTALSACAVAPALRARADAPVRLLTNWYAQAEHGGFYQARETGLYARHGVPVEIAMGGPQMNTVQLLMAGRADVIVTGAEQVLQGLAHGLPLVAIATTFQKGVGGLMAHPDITSLAQLKGHPILISTDGRSSYWPWLRRTYGFTDSQAGIYTFNMQPFVLNPALAMQAFVTSEPYAAQKRHVPYRFFLLSDDGYESYGNMLVTTQSILQDRRQALSNFLAATGEGWKSFLGGDPAPARAAIIRDNPNMAADQVDWSIATLNRIHALGDPGTKIGTLDEARWAAIRQRMVTDALVPASLDPKAGYSLACNDAMTARI